MKKAQCIPVFELVCLAGFLVGFYFLQLLFLPVFKQSLLGHCEQPFSPRATLLIRVHDLLQPPWLVVLVGLLATGLAFIASRAWRKRMPKWRWVPSLVIVIMGVVIVCLVVLGTDNYNIY